MSYELKIRIDSNYSSCTDDKKDLLSFIQNNCYAFGCSIKNVSWQSKYNSYVAFDYEPFCTDGFHIDVTLDSEKEENLLAFKHYYDKKLSVIKYLKNCYSLESYNKLKENNIKFDINNHFG